MHKRTIATALALAAVLTLPLSGCGKNSNGSGSGEPYSYESVTENNAEEIWTSPNGFQDVRVTVEMAVLQDPVAMDGYNMLFGSMNGHEEYRLRVMAPLDFDTKFGDVISVSGLITGNSETLGELGEVYTQIEMTADTATMVTAAPEPDGDPTLQADTADSGPQYGVSIALTGVTVREDETRVHITVTNESEQTFVLLPLSSQVRQNGGQYGQIYNDDASDPNIPYEIPGGSTVSGALVFARVKPADMIVEIQGRVGNREPSVWTFTVHA